jgi:hypothetical protein
MTRIRALQISEKQLEAILDARPALALTAGRSGDARQEEAGPVAFGLAHAVHVAGLRDLVKGEKVKGKPVAIRVLESNGPDITAFYDVSFSAGRPEVLQMAGPGNHYASMLESGIEVASRWMESREGEAELRLLRIPALNTEALLLATKGEEEETAIVIRTLRSEVEMLKPMPLSELVSRLEAPARLILESDDGRKAF